MADQKDIYATGNNKKGSSRLLVALLIVVIAVVTSIITVWLAMMYLFPKEFRPVSLSEREEKALEAKIERLDSSGTYAGSGNSRVDYNRQNRKPEKPLKPERYSEEGAAREISFTEREINGLLANNTDLATRLAIDLSDDLASAKLLVPLDPEFPFIGGKTLKVTAGLELKYRNHKPVVAIKGVSIWGVPMPNAWLGGMKNVDLVSEFGAEAGFWKSFSDGIEDIQVKDGHITIKLRE
jgi:hypothetical protein